MDVKKVVAGLHGQGAIVALVEFLTTLGARLEPLLEEYESSLRRRADESEGEQPEAENREE